MKKKFFSQIIKNNSPPPRGGEGGGNFENLHLTFFIRHEKLTRIIEKV